MKLKHILKKRNEKTGVLGLHKFIICEPSSKAEKELEQRLSKSYTLDFNKSVLNLMVKSSMSYEKACNCIRAKQKLLSEEFNYYLKEFRRMCFLREATYENIIPTVGRSALAARSANDLTYTNVINYGALGSSGTTPTNSDITLGTETYRKATSSQTNASNIAYISNFYTATETTGTYAEAGWFIDGTASADTGQLFSHFLISVTKSNVETLTVESTFTYS